MTKYLPVEDADLDLIENSLKAYTKPEKQPMNAGSLPPVVTEPKPEADKGIVGQAKYPPKEDITMSNKNLGGESIAVPDAGTVPKKEEEFGKPGSKPSAKPGDGEFAGAGDPATAGVQTEAGTGTGPSDKPSAETLSGASETLKARKKAEEDEGTSILDRIKAGRKAEEDWASLRSKMEAALAPVAPKPIAPEPAKVPQQAGSAPVAAPVPPVGIKQQPPVAPLPPAPGLKAEEEDEDEEARKALKNVFDGIVSKGISPEEMKKEFDSVLSQIFQPKGGSENFTNLRSPGMPPGKIPATPGRSGSSEIFRGDTGEVGSQDKVDAQAKENPPGALKTERDAPIENYETETTLVSGTGYQAPLQRGAAVQQFKGKEGPRGTHTEHYTFAKFRKIATGEEVAKEGYEKDRTTPVLKFIQPNRVPTKDEIAALEKAGMLTEDLVARDETESKDVEGSVLLKGLSRFRRQ